MHAPNNVHTIYFTTIFTVATEQSDYHCQTSAAFKKYKILKKTKKNN